MTHSHAKASHDLNLLINKGVVSSFLSMDWSRVRRGRGSVYMENPGFRDARQSSPFPRAAVGFVVHKPRTPTPPPHTSRPPPLMRMGADKLWDLLATNHNPPSPIPQENKIWSGHCRPPPPKNISPNLNISFGIFTQMIIFLESLGFWIKTAKYIPPVNISFESC